MTNFLKPRYWSLLLLLAVGPTCFYSIGCESKPKREKKEKSNNTATKTQVSTDNNPAQSGTNGNNSSSGGTGGTQANSAEADGDADHVTDLGSESVGKDGDDIEVTKAPKKEPPPKNDTSPPNENKGTPPPADKTTPPGNQISSQELTFSISLMEKLCNLDHDGQSGDLEDLVENLMDKKGTPAQELAGLKEYARLSGEEITTFRRLIERIHPKRYDHIEDVICDDFDGNGRIFALDKTVERINGEH